MRQKILALVLSVVTVLSSMGGVVLSQNGGQPASEEVIEITLMTTGIAELTQYPEYLVEDDVFDTYVVVGEDSHPSDVVGSLDIMSRYPELVKETETITEETTLVDGIMRDVSLFGTLATEYPGNGVLKTFHYNMLEDDVIYWNGDDYDFHEQVDISGVEMRHSVGSSNIDGVERMVVEPNDIVYEYIFDKEIDLTSVNGDGTIGNPEYSNPVNIQLLGMDFMVIGVGGEQVKVLQGKVGSSSDENPMEFNGYEIYSLYGNNGEWAKIEIREDSGTVIEAGIIEVGDTKDFSESDLSVQVTEVFETGDYIDVSMVVGELGSVERKYDTFADLEDDDEFPGTDLWGIQVDGFSTDGVITPGDKIQVVYKPEDTQYLESPSSIEFPNEFGELGFEGFNTEDFAEIRIEPVESRRVYDSTGSLYDSGLNGFEISTDTSGTIIDSSTGTGYSESYILFGESSGGDYPVYFAYYDDVKGKIILETEVILNSGSPSTIYSFELNYGSVGDVTYSLDIGISEPSTNPDVIEMFSVGGMSFDYQKSEPWTSTESPEFILGEESSSEDEDVTLTSEGTVYEVGEEELEEIIDDSGLILIEPEDNSDDNMVVFHVPSKELELSTYFGKPGGETDGCVKETIKSITHPVGKLDTESGLEDRNLVLVGGPCANDVVQILVDEGKLDEEFTCGGSAWVDNKAYIIVTEGLGEGTTSTVIAGYEKEETRLASRIAQNYEDYLDVDSSGIMIEGTTLENAVITPL